MASQTVTKTPSTGPGPLPLAPTPPPGTWEHPKMAEISRRQLANVFDERRLGVAAYSIMFLILSFALPRFWLSIIPDFFPFSILRSLATHEISGAVFTWTLRIFQLLVVYNGLQAVYPLLRRKDDMSDIPLTPSQRALLGLGPASAPVTPGSTFITPPRYSRSTSRNASSRAATVGSSPFNRVADGSPINGSPTYRGGSPYSGNSPATGSPLVRKAVGKRASMGGSPGLALTSALDASTDGLSASPSPAGGQRAVSVALNNKWLYKRRNASPAGMMNYI